MDLAKDKLPQQLKGSQSGRGGTGKHDSANGDMRFTKVNGDINGTTAMESMKDQMRERYKQAA